MSAFPGRTRVRLRHQTFQRIFGRAKSPRGWKYAETLAVKSQSYIPLKPEAYKTALSNCCPMAWRAGAALLRKLEIRSSKLKTRTECSRQGKLETKHLPFRSFSLFGNSNLFRISCFDIRICSSLLLVAACCCFSSSAKANAPAVASVDGIDCITAYEADEAPLQICEDSSDPWNDLDEISLPANDRAVIPSRDNHFFSSFCLQTSTFPLTLHQPGIIPAFLFSTQSSFCLHEHLRERAPPSLV
jgi:hypothetical protein